MTAILFAALLYPQGGFQLVKSFGASPTDLAKTLKGPAEVDAMAAWYKLNDSACVWVEFEPKGEAKGATGFAVEFMDPNTSWTQALKAVGLSSTGVKATTAAKTTTLTGIKGIPAGYSVLYKKAHRGNWDNSSQLSIFKKSREDMIRIEAERLTWMMEGGEMVPCDQLLSGSIVVLWENAKDGDMATTKIPMAAPGDYEVFMHCGFDPSMGGMMVDVNGKSKVLDFRYSTSSWRDVSLGVHHLDAPGDVTIKLMALGERAEGNFAYHMGLDWIRIERRRGP